MNGRSIQKSKFELNDEIFLVSAKHRDTDWESNLAQVSTKDEADFLAKMSNELSNKGIENFKEYENFRVEIVNNKINDNLAAYDEPYRVFFIEKALNDFLEYAERKEQNKKTSIKSKITTAKENADKINSKNEKLENKLKGKEL